MPLLPSTSFVAETSHSQRKQSRSRSFLYKWLSFYPPLMGAGIRVRYVPPDFKVRMNLSWFNRNAVGTHFGGSLYAMADPFFMLILMEQLGPEYIVWDKAASIEFLRPGRGAVHANFHIPQEVIEEIRQAADAGDKLEPVMEVDITDEESNVVAHVEKRLYVRKKSEQKEGRT